MSEVEIDLGAVKRNYRRLVQLLAEHSDAERAAPSVCSVVKADAYGHGAVPVSRALEQEGCSCFAVAFLDELEELRAADVNGEVLVLASDLPALPESARQQWRQRLRRAAGTAVVGSRPQLDCWLDQDRCADHPAPLQLKVDTGLARAGFEVADLALALGAADRCTGVEVTGVLSHFAESERLEGRYTERQQQVFDEALMQLDQERRSKLTVHIANSAAALHRPTSHLQMVRVGGALYGIDLAVVDESSCAAPVEPAMTVRSRITQIRLLSSGDSAGYGRRYRARHETRLALVPLGYADGYPTAFSRQPWALVGGRRRAVVGAVSMDALLLDLGDGSGEVGDEVVLLGRQGSECIRARDIADWSGAVEYEVLCRFSRRLPRVLRDSESRES